MARRWARGCAVLAFCACATLFYDGRCGGSFATRPSEPLRRRLRVIYRRRRRDAAEIAAAAATVADAEGEGGDTTQVILREREPRRWMLPTARSTLILSPVHATNARRQNRFVDLLLALDERREDLHVALLVSPDSREVVYSANERLVSADPAFGSVRLFAEPASLASLNSGDQSHAARHALAQQPQRREAIARSRNLLLSLALGGRRVAKVGWVLWLDSDLLWYPPDLLRSLRASSVELVVPTCFCSGDANDACGSGVYDRNSWQDTPESIAELARLDAAGAPDRLVVQGYGTEQAAHVATLKARRLYLDDLATSSRAPLVPLHGVGATCILLIADLHRQGLVFPSFPLNHAIESEGLAQMAIRMGVQPYGRTDVAIRHA